MTETLSINKLVVPPCTARQWLTPEAVLRLISPPVSLQRALFGLSIGVSMGVVAALISGLSRRGEAILLADRVIVLADGKIADQLNIDLPRARDTGQGGFQAIRARLLNLLGVDVDAPATKLAAFGVKRFAHG